MLSKKNMVNSKDTCKATKAEPAKEVKEKQKNVEQIGIRCDEARAGIEKTKALLSCLC